MQRFDDETDILRRINQYEAAILQASSNEERASLLEEHQLALQQLVSELRGATGRTIAELEELDSTVTDDTATKKVPRTHHYHSVVSNNISYVVGNDILSKDSLDQRTLTMERWIAVMKQCLESGDLVSANAIFMGLHQGPVDRLQVTNAGLSPEAHAVLKEFALLNMGNSASTYRLALAGDDSVIPIQVSVVGDILKFKEFIDQYQEGLAKAETPADKKKFEDFIEEYQKKIQAIVDNLERYRRYQQKYKDVKLTPFQETVLTSEKLKKYSDEDYVTYRKTELAAFKKKREDDAYKRSDAVRDASEKGKSPSSVIKTLGRIIATQELQIRDPKMKAYVAKKLEMENTKAELRDRWKKVIDEEDEYKNKKNVLYKIDPLHKARRKKFARIITELNSMPVAAAESRLNFLNATLKRAEEGGILGRHHTPSAEDTSAVKLLKQLRDIVAAEKKVNDALQQVDQAGESAVVKTQQASVAQPASLSPVDMQPAEKPQARFKHEPPKRALPATPVGKSPYSMATLLGNQMHHDLTPPPVAMVNAFKDYAKYKDQIELKVGPYRRLKDHPGAGVGTTVKTEDKKAVEGLVSELEKHFAELKGNADGHFEAYQKTLLAKLSPAEQEAMRGMMLQMKEALPNSLGRQPNFEIPAKLDDKLSEIFKQPPEKAAYLQHLKDYLLMEHLHETQYARYRDPMDIPREGDKEGERRGEHL